MIIYKKILSKLCKVLNMLENTSLNSLRVFKSVYELSSMSKASKALFMTQPGVSQHISALESTLDTKLFDRLGKRLIPTHKANQLYPKVTESLQRLEEALDEVGTKETSYRGIIKIGLPIEIGNNLILPKIAKWSELHPQVHFEFNYDHILRQAPLIVSGDLDFAITDTYSYPKEIHSENLLEENLVLCASKEFANSNKLKKDSDYKSLIKANFIRYLPDAPIVNQWFHFHYQKKPELNYKVTLMDVQGVLRSVRLGLGLGVVPLHVLKQGGTDDIVIFDASKKTLKNRINLVCLKDRTLSPQANDLVLDLLREFKK